MAEISAFVYGWIAGIVAVVVWILYGIDTLLQLMRVVNAAFAYLPGLSNLAYKRKKKKKVIGSGGFGKGGDYGIGGKFDVMKNEEGLEGLTGSTKCVTPITAGGLCLMSWYGPDGTTGPPIECRLALENNEVTVYQLLRLGDTTKGMPGSGGPGASISATSGSKCPPMGQAAAPSLKGRRGKKDGDTNAVRSAAGVTVAEHRKGRVSVLRTTVMELRHFNKPKKGAGEQQGGTGKAASNGGGSKQNRRGNAGGNGSGGDSAADTPQDSKSRRKESRSSTRAEPIASANTAGGVPLEGTTRPGVDPLFNGRVLIWRTMDGRALFDSVRAGRSPSNATFGGSATRRGGGGGADSSRTSAGVSASMSMDSLSDDRSFNSSMDDNEVGDDSEDERSELTGGEGDNGGSDGDSEKGKKGHHHHNNRLLGLHPPQLHKGKHHSKSNAEMNDMANWSCVIVKFERARESERWHTLLSGLREARAWHDFAKTLPNPDTVNTFLSRFFFQNMRVNGLADVIIKQIRKKLRELPAKKFPRDLGGQLILDEFLIGTQIPWITDVSEPTVSANGEVGFDFNLMYKGGEGGFTLFFRLALEFLGIRVPNVVFSVKLIELEATVHISIGPPPSKKFWIGGHKPPVLRLEVHQGCASGKGILHRVLTSLPDLSGIMTNLIKLYLFSDMVLPYMDDFPLPSVVKSPKTSQRDMRVRTFDRQRAAKISGALARSSSAPEDAPSSPLAEAMAKRTEAPAVPSRRASTSAAAAGGATPSSLSPGKSSQPGTPRDANGSVAERPANAGRGSFRDASQGSRPEQDVSSPIPLLSPSDPNAPTSQNGRSGATGSSGNVRNNSMLSGQQYNNNDTMTSSVLNRTAQSEMDLAKSEEALRVTGRKSGGGLSAMRNLKSLLKMKSSDMTRESVSRSKDKRKA